MSCVNSNSQVTVPTADADHRECWSCKQRLHKSSFYKENIKKYYNCIPCERARLAKLRDKLRYAEMRMVATTTPAPAAASLLT